MSRHACNCQTHSERKETAVFNVSRNPLRRDPTHTTSIVRRFERKIRKTSRNLQKAIREAVEEKDAWGLAPQTTQINLNKGDGKEGHVVRNVEREQFVFETDARKLITFRDWLNEEIEAGFYALDGNGDPLTAEFIGSSYRQGLSRAYSDTHKEALSENLDFYRGSKEQFLRDAFNQPETMNKVRLLATRSMEQLHGITDPMAQQLNRIMAEGIANGQHPRTIARTMERTVGNITRTRASRIARTEIIHAHAEGQLNAFEKLGVEELGILAELSTAGDDRVCVECSSLAASGPYTVDEARGMIPVHPNCRCAWVPLVR